MSGTTKIVVSMLDFLRTGHFGPVCLGVSRDDLRTYLGEPESWGPYSCKGRSVSRAGAWKYGDIEFHFSKDSLWLIFADHVDELQGGEVIELDTWIFNGSLLVEQALKSLAEASISCQRIEWPYDGTERFRVGAGIELVFEDETQHLFDRGGVSPMARSGMTFDGFSYSEKQKHAFWEMTRFRPWPHPIQPGQSMPCLVGDTYECKIFWSGSNSRYCFGVGL